VASPQTSNEVELARGLMAGGQGAFDRFVEVFHSKISSTCC